MRKQTTAKVHIKGTRSLIFHAFREEVLTETKKAKTGSIGNNPEEWMDTVQMNKDRELFVTPLNLFGHLRDSAKFTKLGRGTYKDKVAATIIFPDEVFYLKDLVVPSVEKLDRDEKKPVFLHVCSVKNPNTKGRNMRYRIAASKGWELTYQLIWDESIISKQVLKGIIEDGGILQGLMDGRQIGFGRYELIDFTIID